MSTLPCSFAAKLHQNVPAVEFERLDPWTTLHLWTKNKDTLRTKSIAWSNHEGMLEDFPHAPTDFRILRSVLACGPLTKWRGSPSDHRGASGQCRCKEFVPCQEARTGIPGSQSYLRSHPHFSLVITGAKSSFWISWLKMFNPQQSSKRL